MKKSTRTITGLIMTSIMFSLVSCMGLSEDDPINLYGTVVDKETGEGIENILVTCVDDDGNLGSNTRTDSEGEFDFGSDDNLCGEGIVFEDTDGESNGGLYEDVTLGYEYENGGTVEMELVGE